MEQKALARQDCLSLGFLTAQCSSDTRQDVQWLRRQLVMELRSRAAWPPGSLLLTVTFCVAFIPGKMNLLSM